MPKGVSEEYFNYSQVINHTFAKYIFLYTVQCTEYSVASYMLNTFPHVFYTLMCCDEHSKKLGFIFDNEINYLNKENMRIK